MAIRPISGIALCAGTGGLELGISLALGKRYRTVCYVEREAFASAVLVARMEDQTLDRAPIWDDLKSFDGRPWRGKVDIISAGYPCQPFSVAGSRKGEKDERHLWPDVKRVIEEVQPTFCLLENVPGHVRMGLDAVISDLHQMGYDAEWGCVSAGDLGASHKRERLFILAYPTWDQWKQRSRWKRILDASTTVENPYGGNDHQQQQQGRGDASSSSTTVENPRCGDIQQQQQGRGDASSSSQELEVPSGIGRGRRRDEAGGRSKRKNETARHGGELVYPDNGRRQDRWSQSDEQIRDKGHEKHRPETSESGAILAHSPGGGSGFQAKQKGGKGSPRRSEEVGHSTSGHGKELLWRSEGSRDREDRGADPELERPDEVMAHSEHMQHKDGQIRGRKKGSKAKGRKAKGSGNRGKVMADSKVEGLEGGRKYDSSTRREEQTRSTGFCGRELPLFTPGPEERELWERILTYAPETSPSISCPGVCMWANQGKGENREAKSPPERDVCRMVDGLAYRRDRLRLTGNGVFPVVAAVALLSLIKRVFERKG